MAARKAREAAGAAPRRCSGTRRADGGAVLAPSLCIREQALSRGVEVGCKLEPPYNRVPSITIRDLPARLHARLRERAARNRRSLNAEIVHTLDEATGPRGAVLDAVLSDLQRLRAEAPTTPLTEAVWREADAGRP